MIPFLEHIEKIFEFILKETSPRNMIDIIYEKIKGMVESSLVQRDIENFLSYAKLTLSASPIPQRIQFDHTLIEEFIDRTYAESTDLTRNFRVEKLYEYLRDNIDEGDEISDKHLGLIEDDLILSKKSTLESVMEHAHIAAILKWLQGPMVSQLSKELRDYIISLADAYGNYRRGLVHNIEWQYHEVSHQDMMVMENEYKDFENSLTEAIEVVRDAQTKKPVLENYREQFRIVIDSLNNLRKFGQSSKLDFVESFKDKLIVAITLIYIQDDFVRKDPDLQKFIQLFVSLYYRFRDKYYITGKTTNHK